MQNAINATMTADNSQQPAQEAATTEQAETQVDTTAQQPEQQVQTEQPAQSEQQQFDPNWQQQQAVENNTVTPEQDVTTATPEPHEEQQPAFSRDEELNELEAMLKWNQTPTQPEQKSEEQTQPETEHEKEEPISEEENLNYKVKWKEEAAKTSQLEAENYRLQQQLKYANLELEDSTSRYGTLKDRQMELNNDIESLKNKVTPDDLIDLSDKYRVWTNVPNDATSVQLVQTICWLLSTVTWKNADWIFEDYLATRTNKDIPFTSSHSDNTSISTSGRNVDNRISL